MNINDKELEILLRCTNVEDCTSVLDATLEGSTTLSWYRFREGLRAEIEGGGWTITEQGQVYCKYCAKKEAV